MTLIPWWRHKWIRMREGKLSSCAEHLIILLSVEELRLLPAADSTQWKEPKASSCRGKKKDERVCSEAGKEERVIKTCSEHYINHLGADWRLLNGSFLLKGRWKKLKKNSSLTLLCFTAHNHNNLIYFCFEKWCYRKWQPKLVTGENASKNL